MGRKTTPLVMLAAKIAGATRVIRAGGAQAVGALAYGTETVERVDKIVGPGNAWVATAKRLVFGRVDIDMLAQAEHDPDAAAVCIATDRRTAEAVAVQVDEQLRQLPRRAIAGPSIRRYGTILLVPSLARAVEISNEIAPEHLELFIRNARKESDRFRHAGAIFLGEHSTESLGDYAAGPNHVLPTGGSARFSSPLGVYDFVKRTSIIEASAAGLARLAPVIERMALSEGLQGHASAVTRRTRKGGS